jgi:hypothetical protein
MSLCCHRAPGHASASIEHASTMFGRVGGFLSSNSSFPSSRGRSSSRPLVGSVVCAKRSRRIGDIDQSRSMARSRRVGAPCGPGFAGADRSLDSLDDRQQRVWVGGRATKAAVARVRSH